jgi:hypothetical protein
MPADDVDAREAPPVSKLAFRVGLLGLLAFGAVAAYFVVTTIFFAFPRMRDQRSIRPYEAQFAPMPEGVVAVAGPGPSYEAAIDAAPPELTEETRELGETYYRYYCQMCHGIDGKSRTQVADGFIPKPPDLTRPSTQALSLEELYDRMLATKDVGEIIRTTVPVERRWYILQYIKGL